ncbi:MAG: sulfite oxidase [Gemmatimonadales bacterium]|nr:sulfite oxidase [Gemmatimonadales bacterium]MBA3554321.1 sulfite oxidase [Gemmatimonadales bacterium]
MVRDEEGLNTGAWPVPAGEFVTPVHSFFTRSHAPVPDINLATWRLEVDGLVAHPRSFSLEELGRAFPRREVMATLVCAGLRRDEFLSLGALPGELPWGPEPAGTGRWSGVALRDLLQSVGVSQRARHVEFVGLDRVERHGEEFGFGGSIDLDKALTADVLLASELDGALLPAVHGFPLRTIVPGWIGARSVKWLSRISLLEEPSFNYFQRRAYRVQRELDPADPRDVSAGDPLSAVPLNAVILEPVTDQVVPAGRVKVRGWAMGSDAAPLSAVEVSPNDGKDWVRARIAVQGSAWTWSLWESELELAPGSHTLVARATDAAGHTQPETVRETWNVKGYCNNAWHRVAVRAE